MLLLLAFLYNFNTKKFESMVTLEHLVSDSPNDTCSKSYKAIQNVASLYNTGNFKVTDMAITGATTTGSLEVKNNTTIDGHLSVHGTIGSGKPLTPTTVVLDIPAGGSPVPGHGSGQCPSGHYVCGAQVKAPNKPFTKTSLLGLTLMCCPFK